MRIRKTIIYMCAVLAFVLCAPAATKTWDNGAVDSNWSSPDNWDPDVIPGPTDVVYFNQNYTGTNYVDGNFTISGLYYDNVGIIHRTVINSGRTLTVNGDLCMGSLAGSTQSNTCAVIAGPGTLALNGSLWVSGADSPFSLTLDGCRFDVTGLSNVYPGAYGRGVLDMTNAIITSGGMDHRLTMSGVFDTAAGGVVRLPAALKNIQVGGNFTMLYSDTSTQLDFGMNPQLQSFTVQGNCTYGFGEQLVWNGNSNGLPPGVEVRIGAPGSPKILEIGTGPGTPAVWERLSRFDAYLTMLQIGKSAGSEGKGVLDLRGATVVTDGYTNCFRVPTLDMNCTYSEKVELYLPETVTNVTMTNCYLVAEQLPNYAKVVFASNSLLKTFYVAKDILLTKAANIYYIDGTGAEQYGFPPGDVLLKIGSGLQPSQRGTVTIGTDSGFSSTTIKLGTQVKRFDAYLDTLTMSTLDTTHSSGSGILDFRNAELIALDISGRMCIGSGTSGYGDLYLPSGQAKAGDVELGRWSNNYNISRLARGQLWMSNTVFTVTNSLEVGAMGQVIVNLNGASCGIDLLTTNMTVTFHDDLVNEKSPMTNDFYGTITLNFNADPVDLGNPYWGLRVKGNQTNYLHSLTGVPARLLWNTNGLTYLPGERFGIHYDPSDGVTYVGVRERRYPVFIVQ